MGAAKNPGTSSSGTSHAHTLSLTSNVELLSAVRRFIENLLEPHPSWGYDGYCVILAADEVLSNIIEHGYRLEPGRPIELEISVDDHTIRMVIRDTSAPFDATRVDTDFDPAERARAGAKRGLGLFLIRKVVDELAYRRTPGGWNELTLVKRRKRE
jgi:anti-sigma regulatory factor (Ser/Thr protein kinase)